MAITLRPATPDDADLLVEVIDMAGEGLPRLMWGRIGGPGCDPLQVGRDRARRDSGAFSWRNALVAELDGAAAGAIVTYLTEAQPELPDAETPAEVAPLMELEALAPLTRYVNAVGVLTSGRRRGVAAALMAAAQDMAGPNGLSLIVADTNAGARAFYDRQGWVEVARRPVVRGDWQTGARDWILMIRPV